MLFSIVALSQATAAAQDESKSEKAWRFELIEDAHRTQQKDGSFVEVPATPFGELLVSEDLAKCVYRYFRGGRKDSNKKSPYVNVVGIDGEKYWTAGFSRRVEPKGGGFYYKPTKFASNVFVFPNKTTLDKYHELNGHRLFANFVLWYEDAHIHQLINRLNVEKFDRPKLVNALETSDAIKPIFTDGKFQIDINKFGYSESQTVFVPRAFYRENAEYQYFEYTSAITKKIDKLPPQWHAKNGGNWCYLLEIGKDAPFISKCRVQHFAGGTWFGAYPFSTPLSYTIELKPQTIDVPVDSFSPKLYSDVDTELKTIELPQAK